MQFSQALNPRRIARSLVTVLLLTLLETVAAPLLAPHIATPASHAVSGSIEGTSATARSYIIIPAGVESITLTVTGGGGGKGGNDVNAGAKGGLAGRVVVTFQVTPGDVVGLFPGGAGAPGINDANKNTGATSGTTLNGNGGAVAGGVSSVPSSFFSINGASTQNPDFSGGASGKVGDTGSSGSGGGGGAASVVAINRTIVAIAAGAGGGGGAGSATGAGGTQGVDAYSANSNLTTGGTGKSSGSGSSCTSATTDGGSGGGGGGGYYGGTGGNSDLVGNECSGRGGYRGNSFVDASISSSITSFDTSGTPTSPLNGTITYSYDVKPSTSCTPSSQTVDIYTVLKFDASVSCSWTVPSTVSIVDIFAVGGGGGGGGDGGSGGGGGAALLRTAVPVNPNSALTIKVGYGGNGGLLGSRISGDGDSSTVITSTGALYYAMGGNNGGQRSTAGGAGGTAPNNGAFPGGAGGSYAVNSGSVGNAGSYGISNYFYGTQNTYGGGGGGGVYYNSNTNVTGPAGRNGGGAGCSDTAANGMTDGVSGTAGTGGGGGAGGAGDAGRTIGGKGGSGVILIRYTTNSLDSFPASLASALAGRWSADGLQVLDSSRKGWVDSSGTYANSSITGSPIVTTQGTLDGGNSTGSSKSNLIVAGGTSDKVTLVSGALSNYTLMHVARYPRTAIGGSAMTAGRLITASSGNFISGHYNLSNESTAHHTNGWIAPNGIASQYKWLLSTDMTKLYRANGKDLTYKGDVSSVSSAVGPTGLGVNNYSGESTDWQMTDVLVFNRQLTIGEQKLMETYLARIYGLTLDNTSQSSDTDTASTMGYGNYYFFGNYGVGNKFNDIFTIEAWVKPTSDCDSTICQIVTKESTVLFGIHSGYLYWMLNGGTVGGSANWNSTGIRIKPSEWHHVAMVKQFAGDKNGSLLFYLDGKLSFTQAGTPYNVGTNYNSTSASYALVDNDDQWLFVGGRSGNTQYFKGDLDEVKIWKVARSATEIQGDMNSNDGSNVNLQMYYNFNSDNSAIINGPIVPNMADNGLARTDLYTYYTSQFATVESRSTSGPYTSITFPRTIITKNGGWKAPSGISQVQTVVVGGGGGGGGGYQGGGGGAGGFIETLTTLATGAIYPITVGTGGRGTINMGVTSSTDSWTATNGDTTTAFGLIVLGGGRGASEFDTNSGSGYINTTRAALSGGSGGGADWGTGNSTPGSGTSGQGNNGGNGGGGGGLFYGGGGGGAGSVGKDGSGTKGGNGGAAKLSQVTGTYLAGGGGGSVRSANATTFIGYGGDTTTSSAQGGGGNSGYSDNALPGATGGPVNGTANTGGGGGAGLSMNGSNQGYGAAGGSGLVALRYITALLPSYTKPSNAYLNVGMTETFTTNVAVDSATVGLTRTFKWESTTPTASGNYTVLKTGTGAANAAYSWVPSDTSTTGSGYLYRLTVTDSDTSGLFITDSSTAYAVINPTLTMSGVNVIKKQINVARNETFTIAAGTPGYRYTLSPTLPGVTIDTATVGSTLLKISDTASVGTYIETLTVTDSVSASVSIPITLTISAPPNLVNSSSIIENNLIFNIDMANSASYSRSAGTISDISGTKKQVTINGGATFSDDYSGILKLSSSQYLSATGFSSYPSFTVESYINLQSIGGSQACVIGSEQSATNVPFFICLDPGRTVFAGFYNGSWTYKRTSQTIPLGSWTHLLATFDSTTAGTRMEVYINGVVAPLSDSAENAGLVPPAATNDRIFINKWFYTTTGVTTAMDIGVIRIYSAPFTQAKVTQNYNATKDRFAAPNQSQIKPVKKYGLLSLESFTATAGGDTKTISFATGNRTGIMWDTTTVTNQIQLSIQESLLAGTYFDTVTVTDNLGQSTYLPITFSVTKADTITVTSGPSLTTVYTGLAPTNGPVARVSGLVGFDTATVTTSYTSAPGSTCATGGLCSIGDIGPGGGYVFYISGTTIDSATGISDGGTYLEVAPKGWSAPGSEYQGQWAAAATSVSGTSRAVGQGAENTRKIIAALPSTTNLAKVTADLTYGGKSDWFFPSSDEVKAMYTNLFAASKGDFSASNYWASTQDDLNSSPSRADTYWFGAGNTYSPTDKLNSYYLRPIRAFTPGAITTTSTPTDVDTYTATGTNLTFSVGSVSNYQAVVYETSTLKITQANQNKLILNLYGAVAGSPFTLVTTGGSGDGAVTETVTAGSTATNCSVSNRILSNSNSATQQFYCNVLITKASSRNYKSESLTASVYFMVYLNSQPSNQAGSGSTIGLNGVTSLETSTVLPPAITSLSVSTLSLSSGITTFTITGSGFTGTITVKFWRNKIISATSSNGTTIDIPVSSISSAGATSGRIAVITSAGEAVSVDSLTITP